jgi:hypothetical protein
MLDPLTVVTGVGLALTGMGLSRLLRTARAPVCGCEHRLAFHEPLNGKCRAACLYDAYDENGTWTGQVYYECACRQYDGPHLSVWAQAPPRIKR